MALSMKSAMVQRPVVQRPALSRTQAARAAVPRRQVSLLAAVEHVLGCFGGQRAVPLVAGGDA